MERWLRGGRPSSYVFGRTKSWSVPRLVHVGVNLSTVTEQCKILFCILRGTIIFSAKFHSPETQTVIRSAAGLRSGRLAILKNHEQVTFLLTKNRGDLCNANSHSSNEFFCSSPTCTSTSKQPARIYVFKVFSSKFFDVSSTRLHLFFWHFSFFA